MSWFAKFLMSRASGWIAVAAVTLLLGGGWFGADKIRQLQIDAAECRGELRTQEELTSLREQVAVNARKGAEEVKNEVVRIKEEAEQALESGEAVPQGPSGCAAERAPDAILRYHGWLRDGD